MRLPRLKRTDQATWYHMCSRVVGPRGLTPLQEWEVQQKFKVLLQLYLSVYFCELAAWALLGNHDHLVMLFAAYRRLSQRELWRRACQIYPRPADRPQTKRQWKAFNRRLFDVSEFMRNLNGAFASWYNRRFDRRGSLFAGRFKSTILSSPQDVINAMIYVDLNAVRAGLVSAPEQWRWGSAWERAQGEDAHLMPLSSLLKTGTEADCRQEYQWRLYWRGAVGGREGQAKIPVDVVEAELARGFAGGEFLQRQRCFSEGVVMGSLDVIEAWAEKLRRWAGWQRRRRPVEQINGICYTLRAQRTRNDSRSPFPSGVG